MTALILEILFCLALAFLAGLALAWWWRSRRAEEALQRLRDTWEGRYGTAQSENRALREDRDRVAGELEQTLTKVTDLEGQYASRGEELTAATSLASDWQAKFETKDKDLVAANALVSDWEVKFQSKDKELVGANSQVSDWKGKFESKEKELQAANGKVGEWEQKFQALEKELAAQKNRYAELDESRQGLERDLEEARSWKAKFDQASTKVSALEGQLNEADDAKSSLRSELESKSQELGLLLPLRSQVDELETEVSGLRAARDRVKTLEQEVATLAASKEEAAGLQARIKVLEAELRSHEREASAAKEAKTQLTARLAGLEGDLTAARKEAEDAADHGALERAWRLRFNRQASLIDGAKQKLDTKSAAVTRLEAQIKSYRAQLRRLVASRDAKPPEPRVVEVPVAAPESAPDEARWRLEVDRFRRDLDAARRRLRERDGRIHLLERLLRKAKRPAATPRRRVQSVEAEKPKAKVAVKPSKAKVAKKTTKKKPVKKKAAKKKVAKKKVKKAAKRTKDDLKKIHGIGPAIERELNKRGVSYYRQIAKWTKKDIEKFSKVLEDRGWFPGRITRDSWKRHARNEHFKKYGKRLPR